MPLRETRRFKTKGFVISFGDFMLPLVGLAAIGLLLVAGKIFFFSDFQADSQPIPVSVAPPDIPRSPINSETPRADAGESASRPPSETQAAVNQPQTPIRATIGGNLILDLGHDNRARDNVDSLSRNNESQGDDSAREENIREEIVIVSTPAHAPANPPQPRPTPPAPSPEPQPGPRPVESRPVASIPTQPNQAQPESAVTQPERTNWMVQIGAFSTRAAAESVLQRVTQDGHSATVLSGRTLYRVLVQAGPTKQEALDLATRFGQTGFPGAFVVPPRS